MDVAAETLPAWFSERMMGDYWHFGLLLVTGQTLMIDCITNISQDSAGTIWLDVEMTERSNGKWSSSCPTPGMPIYSPTSRTKASVNAAHVVAAFEMADT